MGTVFLGRLKNKNSELIKTYIRKQNLTGFHLGIYVRTYSMKYPFY